MPLVCFCQGFVGGCEFLYAQAHICFCLKFCLMNIELLFSIFVETFSCWAVLSQLIVVEGESEGGADIGAKVINNNLPFFEPFAIF